MNKKIDDVISILKSGKQLSEEYLDILFPTQHKEYELTYQGKKRKQQILSSADEPQSVPFQIQKQFGVSDGWNNLLIFGDNYQILKTIYENKDELIKDKIKGKVKLIYVDPPFATSDEFNGKEGQKAYRDKVNGAEFIEFIRQRLFLAKELLANDGIIYVHLDHRMVHYIKVVMDEVFGKNNFRNQITWRRQIPRGMKIYAEHYAFSADYILIYSKTDEYAWNRQVTFNKLTKNEANKKYKHDCNGYFRTSDPGSYTFESLLELYSQGRLYAPYNGEIIIDYDKRIIKSSAGGKIAIKYYREEKDGFIIEEKTIDNIWEDIPGMGIVSSQYLGYPTQKPEALLERVIQASTNEGDLVMDFFAGSGTTGFVAEKLNRRWIMCDIGKFSMYTIRKRFLTKEGGHKPFALVNAAIYDLKEVFELDKVKYDTFVKNLFHIDADRKIISGISVDGKRRGDWVKIFDFHYFQTKGNVAAINEKYIEDLHKQIGKKVGNKFYLVAPEINIDIIDNYIELDGVRYYLLRIPYQAIKELHKADFKKPQQPNSKTNINAIETSIGFYFNEPPEVKSSLKNDGNRVIVNIESIKPQYKNLTTIENILAMVLIDTADGEEFVMQDYYFADEIKSKEENIEYQIVFNKKNLMSKKIRIVCVDIFGNEFIETLDIK